MQCPENNPAKKGKKKLAIGVSCFSFPDTYIICLLSGFSSIVENKPKLLHPSPL